MKKCTLPLAAFAMAAASTAFAADYYVATTGDDTNNDGLSDQTPFATIDKAITSATNASDVIHVAEGTYSTTTQWGPNLKAKLVGEGVKVPCPAALVLRGLPEVEHQREGGEQVRLRPHLRLDHLVRRRLDGRGVYLLLRCHFQQC